MYLAKEKRPELRRIAKELRNAGKIEVDLRSSSEVLIAKIKPFFPTIVESYESGTYFEDLPTDAIAEIASRDPEVFELLTNIERFSESTNAIEFCRQKFKDEYVTVYYWDNISRTIYPKQAVFSSRHEAIEFLDHEYRFSVKSDHFQNTWFVYNERYAQTTQKGLLDSEKIGHNFVKGMRGKKRKLNMLLQKKYESVDYGKKLPQDLIERVTLIKQHIKIKEYPKTRCKHFYLGTASVHVNAYLSTTRNNCLELVPFKTIDHRVTLFNHLP